MEIQSVMNKYGELEPFQPRRITYKIMEETGLDKEEASKIQNNVIHALKSKYTENEISTSTIRSLINQQLISKGFIEEEKKSRKLGMSVSDFEDLLENGNKDNANIFYSPEMIAKYSYDAIAKEYALLTMPKECAEAHKKGYIHLHDLEYWNTRPNCANWSIPFIAKNGIKIDGNGEYGSATSPAKSLEVLLNHMLEFLMSGALFLSGGQSFSSFNVYLAPYCKNKTYDEIKQAIQNFIFNCNCALIARGGQTIFSSINIEFEIPNFLKDEPAISIGGKIDGVYGDYEKEVKLLFKAIVEVTKEKDANGRYHTFPNQIYMVRDGTFDKYNEEVKMVHELLAENPTIYFSNVSEEYTENAVTMGALSSDTPVMTNEGFKYPRHLRIGDKVMTYSKDGSKEWNKIYNIIPKSAPSNVFKISLDNGYQFKITNNHKLPTNKGIIKSEDLEIGMELYDYIDEPYIPTDDVESEFLGVFLADGYIRDENRVKYSSGNDIDFHVKQEWKKNEIVNLCELNNYKYELKVRKDNTYTICVKEKQLRDKFNSCYDKNGLKHFPKWIWDDKNKISNVIKGMMFDGRNESKKAWVWSCSDLPLVIDFLYALSYIGRKSKIYVDNRCGKSGNWRTNYRISFGLNYEPKNKTTIKSIELVNNNETVYDLSIENNPNYVCGLGGIHSENCRTRMPQTFTGDYAKDCLNVGNFHYVTLNLPLIALESKDYNDFQVRLTHYMNISRLALLDRKKNVEDVLYNKHMSDFLIQKDTDTGEQLYDIERCSFSIGLCGLNECLLTLFDMDIIEGIDYGEDIIRLMTDNLEIFKENDGLRWSLFFTPAESTAHRFAEINMQKYPNEAIVQGEEDYYYLTNSSHIDVSNDANIIEHIKNADVFHKYAVAGNICHLWLGEAFPNPMSLYSLNKKIAKTNIKFWAFTNDYTYCRNCHNTIQLNKLNEYCPFCGSDDLLVMSRITGYYQPVASKNGGGFNNGKLQEFKDRYRHKINS